MDTHHVGSAGDGNLETERVVGAAAVDAVEIEALVIGQNGAGSKKRVNHVAKIGAGSTRRKGGVAALMLIAGPTRSAVMEIVSSCIRRHVCGVHQVFKFTYILSCASAAFQWPFSSRTSSHG